MQEARAPEATARTMLTWNNLVLIIWELICSLSCLIMLPYLHQVNSKNQTMIFCLYFTDLMLPKPTLIARLMESTWGPTGADRTQVGPMLATWTLLSGYKYSMRKRSIPWLLMPWRLALPGYQRPWHYLYQMWPYLPWGRIPDGTISVLGNNMKFRYSIYISTFPKIHFSMKRVIYKVQNPYCCACKINSLAPRRFQ